MAKCQECDERKATHEDPRGVPMGDGNCLCKECCLHAFDSMIEEHEDQIAKLKREKQKVEVS